MANEPSQLEKFMQEAQPGHRRSRLDAHHDDIQALIKADYSLRQIVEYLKTKDCKVTPSTLAGWIKRRQVDQVPDVAPSQKQNPPSAGGGKGSDKKEPETVITAAQAVENDGGSSELVRPPGMSNAEWSKLQVEHKAKQRRNNAS